MPKISVIVPVYNVENYINKCLDSLVNQSLDDIEIILVNDGSTDNSQNIINEYKIKNKYNKKIILINKEKTESNNYKYLALKYAHGEFVLFLNSYDYLHTNMIKTVYDKAIKGNYDIVYCNLIIESNKKSIYLKQEIKKDFNSISIKDIRKILINSYPTLCNKLFRKSFLLYIINKNYPLLESNLKEYDILLLYMLLPNIHNIGIVDTYLCTHVNSLNKKITKHTISCLIKNLDNIIEYYHLDGLFEDYEDILKRIYIQYLYQLFSRQILKLSDKTTLIKDYNKYKRLIKKNFPNYKFINYLLLFRYQNVKVKYFI